MADQKPRMRVKLTLNAKLQSKLIIPLHTCFGITESFFEDHIIIVSERAFVEFLFELKKVGENVTMDQMKAEYIDLNKQPRITVVRKFGDQHHNYEILEKNNEPQ